MRMLLDGNDIVVSENILEDNESLEVWNIFTLFKWHIVYIDNNKKNHAHFVTYYNNHGFEIC